MSNPPKFSIDDTAPGGHKIVYIYGQTNNVLVYRTKDDSVAYYLDQDHVSNQVGSVLATYQRVRATAFRAYPRAEWKTLQDELGASLFNGLSARDEASASIAFDEIQERIADRLTNHGRLCYLIAATGATTVFILIGLVLYLFVPDKAIYAVYMMFAVGGAFASVIGRTAKLTIDTKEDSRIIALRGIYRIVLGILFAAFMVGAAKANLIAGIVSSTPWAFVAYSFLCGFSERFAPEILANFEQKAVKGQHAKK